MATTQDVNITHMPDNSAARVGYDMYHQLRSLLPEKQGLDRIKQSLSLFSACRNAAAGRNYDTELGGLT